MTGENITIQGGSFSTNITRYVPEGVQLRQKDGWYTVGAAAKLDLTWLWLAIAGAAVLAAVLVPVLIITIKKKKQNG